MSDVRPALRSEARDCDADDASLPLETLPNAADIPKHANANPLFAHADIHDYYWAPRFAGGDDDSDNATPSTFVAARHHSTINSSATDRDKFKYVMLFHDANPRWESDGIIFVKSSLRILPGGETFKDDPPLTVITRKHAPRSGGKAGAWKTRGWKKRRGDLDNDAIPRQADTAEESGEQVKAGKESDEDAKDMFIASDDAGKDKEAPEKEGMAADDDKNTAEPIEACQGESTPAKAHAQDLDAPVAPSRDTTDTPELSQDTTFTPDLSLYDTGPIAVFAQTTKSQSSAFRFTGYYKLTRLQYLAPGSPELYRMLEQKFTTVDRFGRTKQRYRSAESWANSMAQRWAVVKMENDEDANTNLPPPNIVARSAADKAKTGTVGARKSVNELL